MKFLMSKKTCIPKTTNDVQKELCKKPDLGRSKFELLGPNNKYRDEYYELYLARCEEFKMKGKKIQDANMKALSNNKPKLGEIYRMMLVEVDQDEDTNRKAELKKSELKLTSATSLSSFSNIREVGIALRKRHERYYRDVWDVNEKQCYFDPWFRRYLILCRFISAARKIIIKSRLLKRLAVFKELKRNKELIPVYEDQYIKIQHLSYANVFAKFDPL